MPNFTLHKEVVPFAITHVFEGNGHSVSNERKSEMPSSIVKVVESLYDRMPHPRDFTWSGWNFQAGDPSVYPDSPEQVLYGDLIPYVLLKGNKRVYLLNENEYADQGHMQMTFFATLQGSLLRFCEDFGLDESEIVKNHIAVQWI